MTDEEVIEMAVEVSEGVVHTLSRFGAQQLMERGGEHQNGVFVAVAMGLNISLCSLLTQRHFNISQHVAGTEFRPAAPVPDNYPLQYDELYGQLKKTIYDLQVKG